MKKQSTPQFSPNGIVISRNTAVTKLKSELQLKSEPDDLAANPYFEPIAFQNEFDKVSASSIEIGSNGHSNINLDFNADQIITPNPSMPTFKQSTNDSMSLT